MTGQCINPIDCLKHLNFNQPHFIDPSTLGMSKLVKVPTTELK